MVCSSPSVQAAEPATRRFSPRRAPAQERRVRPLTPGPAGSVPAPWLRPRRRGRPRAFTCVFIAQAQRAAAAARSRPVLAPAREARSSCLSRGNIVAGSRISRSANWLRSSTFRTLTVSTPATLNKPPAVGLKPPPDSYPQVRRPSAPFSRSWVLPTSPRSAGRSCRGHANFGCRTKRRAPHAPLGLPCKEIHRDSGERTSNGFLLLNSRRALAASLVSSASPPLQPPNPFGEGGAPG